MNESIKSAFAIVAFAAATCVCVSSSQAAGRPCEPVHIEGGGAGYCAIRGDGRVACWGGEVLMPPYSAAPAGRFLNVSVGSYEGCGVREDGSGVCWRKYSTEELEGEFLQLSVSTYVGVHALRADGTLDYIPFDDNTDQDVPEGTFVEVDNGCAIRTDHTLQCLDGTVPLEGTFERVSGPCAIAEDGALRCWGGWEDVVDAPASDAFRHLSSSSGFSPLRSSEGICAVTQDGNAACWGNNLIAEESPQEEFREVAFGYGWPWGLTTDARLVPWAPWPEQSGYNGNTAPLVGTFAQIAAGGDGVRPLSCGVESSGRLHCWGSDQFGQVSTTPDGDFLEVGAGPYHACGIKSDHTIECWGNDDAVLDLEAPAGTFESLAIGWFGPNCALRTNGTIACWGFGELVLDVPSGSFETVSASGHIACALDDGIPTCWRYVYGETQDEIEIEPVDVPDGSFAEIANYFDGGPSRQDSHVCGRRPNGQVTCWTGDEELEPWTAPGGVFTKLAPSGAAACGIRSNGQIECWGPEWLDPDYLVPPEGEFVAVASGGGQVCGLTADGTVVCTGHDQTVSLCAPSLLCGNGEIDDSESCDDGDASFAPGDACTGGCWSVPCGQPIHPDAEGPVASDALFTLRAAVGSSSCVVEVCDVDGSSAVTSTDALAILRKSVNPQLVLGC